MGRGSRWWPRRPQPAGSGRRSRRPVVEQGREGGVRGTHCGNCSAALLACTQRAAAFHKLCNPPPRSPGGQEAPAAAAAALVTCDTNQSLPPPPSSNRPPHLLHGSHAGQQNHKAAGRERPAAPDQHPVRWDRSEAAVRACHPQRGCECFAARGYAQHVASDILCNTAGSLVGLVVHHADWCAQSAGKCLQQMGGGAAARPSVEVHLGQI